MKFVVEKKYDNKIISFIIINIDMLTVLTTKLKCKY